MSTILDSLKKSSDQRDDHNDQAIDNFSFSKQKNSTRRSLWLLILLMAMAAAAYVAYDYWLSRQELLAENDNKNAVSTVADKTIVAEKDQKPVDLTLSDAQQQRQQDAQLIAPKKPKPDSAKVKQDMMTLTSQTNDSDTSLIELKKPEDSKMAVSQDPQMIEPSKSKKNAELSLKPVTPTTQQDQRLSMDVKPDNNGRANRMGNKKDTPLAQQKRARNEQEYLFLYQLPFSIRKEIPRIKLNIHVYDEDPEKRIAILNGVRFSIDDSIEEGILLVDIIEEGAVLEVNGQQFLIPK